MKQMEEPLSPDMHHPDLHHPDQPKLQVCFKAIVSPLKVSQIIRVFPVKRLSTSKMAPTLTLYNSINDCI